MWHKHNVPRPTWTFLFCFFLSSGRILWSMRVILKPTIFWIIVVELCHLQMLPFFRTCRKLRVSAICTVYRRVTSFLFSLHRLSSSGLTIAISCLEYTEWVRKVPRCKLLPSASAITSPTSRPLSRWPRFLCSPTVNHPRQTSSAELWLGGFKSLAGPSLCRASVSC